MGLCTFIHGPSILIPNMHTRPKIQSSVKVVPRNNWILLWTQSPNRCLIHTSWLLSVQWTQVASFDRDKDARSAPIDMFCLNVLALWKGMYCISVNIMLIGNNAVAIKKQSLQVGCIIYVTYSKNSKNIISTSPAKHRDRNSHSINVI